MRTPVAQGVARELPAPVPLYSQIPEVNGSEETVTSIQETLVETGHPKYSKRDVIVTRDPFYTCPMGFSFEGKLRTGGEVARQGRRGKLIDLTSNFSK